MPECGLVLYPSEAKPKEGETVELQYIPATNNDKNNFHWFHENNKIINNGGRFLQSIDSNNVHVLRLVNINQNQTGHYKVQCASGIQTAPVYVVVCSKLI